MEKSPPEGASSIEDAYVAYRLGNRARALEILGSLPRNPTAEDYRRLRLLALCAMAEGRFRDARRLWRDHGRVRKLRDSDRIKLGLTLEALGDVTSAIETYRSVTPGPGVNYGGALHEARLHERLGHYPAALSVLDAQVELAAGSELQAGPRHMRGHVASLAGRVEIALSDYVILDQLEPSKPDGLRGQIAVYLQNRDHPSAIYGLKLAEQRFPGEVAFLKLEASLWNQKGSDDDLVFFLDRVAALRPPNPVFRAVLSNLFGSRAYHFSKALRARFADRLGDQQSPELKREILSEKIPLQPAARLEWDRQAIDKLAEATNSPRGIQLRGRSAERLIALGRFDEALVVIRDLERAVRNWPYTPPVIGEVIEWRAVRMGQVDRAQRSYWFRRRMVAGRDRSDELECVRPLPGPPPPVVVFCQLRNELPILPAFLKHYRQLGVRQFVMIDHDSNDGGFQWLKAQPDVELYRTRANFRRAEAGNNWINPLIARQDYADTLCLRVDADEHLVYPHFETKSLATLWQYMREEGSVVLAGHMLDMMPERLSEFDEPGAEMTAVARYFDPLPQPTPLVTCPYVGYYGGPRSRLLGVVPRQLTKCSGIRGGGSVEQIHASHRASPARVCSVGMVLLHYKFRPDFFERAARIIDEHQYADASQEYSRYHQLNAKRGCSLLSDGTLRYEGSSSLIGAGVLRTTATWDARSAISEPIVVKWPQGGVVRENWGDKLNPHLVQLLSGRPVRNAADLAKTDLRTPIYSVIGSHLGGLTRRHTVWGTGFIAATDRIKEAPGTICAVRGPLTRQMLLAQEVECPEVYGDPALLYPLFYRPQVEKAFDLGVIMHVRDRMVASLPAIPPGLKVREIDINGGIDDVIDQICRCRHIASSSLHGLIAAHAYRVPAVWLSFGDRLKGDGLKFRDYFLSIGLTIDSPVLVDAATDCRSLIAQCRLPAQGVDLVALLAACPLIDERRKTELQARIEPGTECS